MAETPDFEQIATTVFDHVGEDHDDWDGTLRVLRIAKITEQLRLAWNARGAADIATIQADLSSMMGPTAAGPYVKNLDRALRKLDR